MPFFKRSDIRQYAMQHSARRNFKAANQILRESETAHYTGKTYDVFLSHSVKDAEIVLGVKEFLEQQKFTVYVDWLEDTQLDRSNVTPATADILRKRMKSCSSLIFIATENASTSKWMPWELGYFDGYRENAVAIFPVIEDWQHSFDGQEYLGLYPVIEKSNSGYGTSYTVRRKNSSYSQDLARFTRGQATAFA
ncbi:MAG TPA: toll/interleukin-1 receptor domain-containing protein [Noviherbaspirillum sp.]|nr:toll/interleukin-1 receptor domain-containing protein [Noviherbaspirillum sp.]